MVLLPRPRYANQASTCSDRLECSAPLEPNVPRLATHPFVGGNKRTALNTVVVFYFLNGYRFSYDEEIVDVLKRIASNEADLERPEVLEYFRSHVEKIVLEDTVDEWRDDLLAYGVDRLAEERSDPND